MRTQHPFPIYYSLFLIFFVTTTILISPSLGALGKCNPSDYKALRSIKKSFYKPYILDSWAPNTDCCNNNWIGVRCDDKTNRVNQLFMFIGELSGQIPSSVGDLPYLESLVFRHYKNITGSIPQSITKLKHLGMLDLSDMSLSGPIPHSLNQLTALAFLDLSGNQLSGSIPPNLSNLKHIATFHLARNKLTGPIPHFPNQLTDLTFLDLSDNQLSGYIPPSLSNLKHIATIYLAGNKLTGSIPESFGKLPAGVSLLLSRNKLTVGDASMLFNPNHSLTTRIDLSRNRFSFDLTKVKFPKNLNWLDISHNKIYGGIPEEIKGLENLQTLKMGYNRLCGKIPTGGIMKRFKRTSFYHNKCLH
ncbi:hypothetical protein MKW94_010648 [Papaver nudicaule]|uniref:Leucine-rich repeat-containing N-terminal plant-type domain-containing protein n=1 Tax=Papaver nudicaule TaxID=74823 RepID=A0AA41VNP8_PAPNU|nr:hypothetical protein [Papaver nudicaule]